MTIKSLKRIAPVVALGMFCGLLGGCTSNKSRALWTLGNPMDWEGAWDEFRFVK